MITRVFPVFLVAALAAAPARAVPSIEKVAAKSGLAGAAVITEEKTHRGERQVWERWESDQGRRWRITTYSKERKEPDVQHFLELKNGRRLEVSSRWFYGEGRERFRSRWKAKGTIFEQETRVIGGKTQTYSRRLSGNGGLKRVTFPGLDPSQPHVYSNGGLGADIPWTLREMAKIAKSTDHDVLVDINAVDVLAHPGETATQIADRAQAAGAFPFGRPLIAD